MLNFVNSVSSWLIELPRYSLYNNENSRPSDIAEPEHFDNLKNCLEPKDFLKRARSLMVVASTPPTQKYEEFTKQVREYSSKEPFNFPVPELLKKYEKVFELNNRRVATVVLFFKNNIGRYSKNCNEQGNHVRFTLQLLS